MPEILPDFVAFLVRPLGWFMAPLSIAVGASLFTTPAIRSVRNAGIAACYLALPAGILLLEWGAAMSAWLVLGVTAGISYWAYEMVSHFAVSPDEKEPLPSLSTILHGMFAWPLMLPEVIEYTLSDSGLLPRGDVIDS